MTTNYGERPGIEVQHTPGPWTPALLEMAERALAFVESMPGADNVNLAADLRAVIAQARGEVAK